MSDDDDDKHKALSVTESSHLAIIFFCAQMVVLALLHGLVFVPTLALAIERLLSCGQGIFSAGAVSQRDDGNDGQGASCKDTPRARVGAGTVSLRDNCDDGQGAVCKDTQQTRA